MLELNFDMAQTIAFAVVLLLIGRVIKKWIPILERFFIPAPVIGGTLFSIILLIGHQTESFTINFNGDIRVLLMTAFFTTIGFSASLKILKSGGIGVLIFLIVATILVIIQDVVGVSLAKVFGIDPLIGLAAGSIPLTGGHGTSAAIAPTIEALGIKGAGTVAIASATFGLIAGSMMGGPIANKLILKHKLLGNETLLHEKHDYNSDIDENVLKKPEPALNAERFSMAFFFILIAMGIGSYLSIFITKLLPAMNFPIYIGPMIIAAIMRNISDNSEMFTAPTREISVLEDVSLNLFLAMALMSLKLWELIDLAIPMLILLVAQVVLIYLYLNFITFKAMGSDYDAAVIVSGHCGFGLGAAPNGISNMKSVCEKYKYSKIAFFVVHLKRVKRNVHLKYLVCLN